MSHKERPKCNIQGLKLNKAWLTNSLEGQRKEKFQISNRTSTLWPGEFILVVTKDLKQIQFDS